MYTGYMKEGGECTADQESGRIYILSQSLQKDEKDFFLFARRQILYNMRYQGNLNRSWFPLVTAVGSPHTRISGIWGSITRKKDLK